MAKKVIPKVSDELKRAVELYLLAKTIRDDVAEKLHAIKSDVLARRQFQIRDDIADGQQSGTINDPDFDFMMSEGDFEIYMADCYEMEIEAGLNPEFVGHAVQYQYDVDVWACEQLIVEASEYITGITWETVRWQMDNRKKYIDLTIRFVLSACPEITGDATVAKYLN